MVFSVAYTASFCLAPAVVKSLGKKKKKGRCILSDVVEVSCPKRNATTFGLFLFFFFVNYRTVLPPTHYALQSFFNDRLISLGPHHNWVSALSEIRG